MKPYLSALLLVLIGTALRGQTATTPNEGLMLTYDPEVAAAAGGLPYTLSWWGRAGRTYYVEWTDDLVTGTWYCYNRGFLLGNSGRGESVETFNFAQNSEKFFVRVFSPDGNRTAADLPFKTDSDHDGIIDQDELTLHGTHPFRNVDNDGDDLPDDWEMARYTNLDAPVSENTAHYAEFKADWLKGVHVRYGPQFFYYQAYDAQNHVLSMDGDQDGKLYAIFTDDTLSTLQSIEVYPRIAAPPTRPLPEDDPYGYLNQPRALYTFINDSDPTKRGLVFEGIRGVDVVANPETGAVTSTPSQYIGRDLLRTFDTMLYKPGATRPNGATVPMPYRRITVHSESNPTVNEVRRVPAPLAITSLPLTQISRSTFPVIIRDVPHNRFPTTFPDAQNWPFPGTPGAGAVKTELDADGLPEAVDDPTKYTNPAWDMFRSPATFRTWYRGNDAVTYSVPGISPGFHPAGTNVVYNYGIYGDGTYGDGVTGDAFYPHTNDVDNRKNFTSELHMMLDYTPETKLYLAADDDCWVFINGKLLNDLDRGGVGLGLSPKIINFSDLSPEVKVNLGIANTIGTCSIDIFHADRLSSTAQLRFLSNTSLRPLYTYQVIAELAAERQIHFEFGTDPVNNTPIAPPGMEINVNTGKITWDLYNPSSIPASIGPHQVKIRAYDNAGNADEQIFNVNVLN